MCVEKEFSQDPIFASPGSNIVDGSEARVTKMNEYDVQMASTGSAPHSKRCGSEQVSLLLCRRFLAPGFVATGGGTPGASSP